MITDQKVLEHVNKQLDKVQKQIDSDDKILTNMLLLVTTGAFGLSINFFTKPGYIFKSPDLLKFSWAFLVVSLVANTIGYYLSREGYENINSDLNNKISEKENFSAKDFQDLFRKYGQSHLSILIKTLNIVVAGTFITGILLLARFAILQLN